jgi:phage gp36-like protein
MGYCTQANMIAEVGEQELIQLTDRSNLGVIDTVVLAKALANADAKINSYLTGYVLPLSSIPANFELMAGDIARFYLFKDAVPDVVKARFIDAIKYLEQVSTRKILLATDAIGVSANVETSIDSVAYTQVAPDNFGRCGY